MKNSLYIGRKAASFIFVAALAMALLLPDGPAFSAVIDTANSSNNQNLNSNILLDGVLSGSNDLVGSSSSGLLIQGDGAETPVLSIDIAADIVGVGAGNAGVEITSTGGSVTLGENIVAIYGDDGEYAVHVADGASLTALTINTDGLQPVNRDAIAIDGIVSVLTINATITTDGDTIHVSPTGATSFVVAEGASIASTSGTAINFLGTLLESGFTNNGDITGSLGSLHLSGTISAPITNNGTMIGGVYISSLSGGTLTNTGIIQDAVHAIFINGDSSALISNSGTLSGTLYVNGTTSGNITNTGVITASSNAIYLSGDVSSIVRNTGTISETIYANGEVSGSIENTGSIIADLAIFTGTLSGALYNNGALTCSGTICVQTAGLVTGSITNDANGVISGGSFGLYVSSGFAETGVITNRGTVTASVMGMQFAGISEGLLSNTGTIAGNVMGLFFQGDSSATINNDGYIHGNTFGIYTVGMASGDITNSGIIDAGTVGLNFDQSYSGTLINTGSILASQSITISGDLSGTLINSGILGSVDAGSTFGLLLMGDLTGTVSNSGTIYGSTQGIAMGDLAGSIVNTGTITSSGSQGVYLSDLMGAFNNSGTIYGLNAQGVAMDDLAGSFVNTGTITSDGSQGIYISGILTGTFSNSGTIYGPTQGLSMGDLAGSLVNTGTITSSSSQVISMGDLTGTFYNSGSLLGDYSGVNLSNLTGAFSNSGTITGTDNEGVYIGGDLSGTFNNSGSILSDYNGVSLSNLTGTFSNSGTIVGTTNMALSVSGLSSTLLNSGTISSSFIGVSVSSSAETASFTNTGTISGGFIGVSFMDFEGSLINTGVIQSDCDLYGTIGVGSAISMSGASGTVTSLINSGSLISYSSTGKAIDASYNPGTMLITNSGTIYGSVLMGSSDTLTINGGSISGFVSTTDDGTNGSAVILSPVSSYTVEGDMGSDTALLSNLSVTSGAVTLEGSLYSNALAFQGGTILLANNAAVVGSTSFVLGGVVVNLGTYKLTTTSASHTGGNLSITSPTTILTTIGTSSHGYIDAGLSTGFFTNTSSLTIRPIVASGTTVNLGNDYLFLNAPTGTVNIGTIAMANTGLLRSSEWVSSVAGASGTDVQGISYNNGSVLISKIAVTAPAAITIDGVTPNGARVLDALISDQETTGSLTILKGSIESFETAVEVAAAGSQLHPQDNGALVDASYKATFMALNQMDSHLTAVRQFTEDFETIVMLNKAVVPKKFRQKGLSVWMEALGSFGKQSSRDEVNGYSTKARGIVMGADTLVANQTRAGAALSFVNTDVSDKERNAGDSSKIKSYQASAYASYLGKPWFVDGSLAFTYHDYNTNRAVGFAGFNDKAESNHHGLEYTARLKAGYPLTLGPVIVTPMAGATYTLLDQRGYKESSENGAALAVGAVKTSSIRSSFGATLSKTLKSGRNSITPEFRAMWQHEFNRTAFSSTNRFVSGGNSFDTFYAMPQADIYTAGFGLNIANKNGLSVSVNYDIELKERAVNHAAFLQVRSQF